MSYFDKFSEWQNYAHYILLTIGLFIWHALPFTTVVEQNYLNTLLGVDKYIALGQMFGWYLLGLFIIDSIVHAIFWYLPEPLQWRD